MLMATTTSTALSTGSGMKRASGAATSTISRMVSEWTMPATGVRGAAADAGGGARERAGGGQAAEERAPDIGRAEGAELVLESCLSSIMPSETTAQSSDSMAASNAMVKAGRTRLPSWLQSNCGQCGAGRPRGDGVEAEA